MRGCMFRQFSCNSTSGLATASLYSWWRHVLGIGVRSFPERFSACQFFCHNYVVLVSPLLRRVLCTPRIILWMPEIALVCKISWLLFYTLLFNLAIFSATLVRRLSFFIPSDRPLVRVEPRYVKWPVTSKTTSSILIYGNAETSWSMTFVYIMQIITSMGEKTYQFL